MTSPLILLVHERILPGGQLVHRLEDEGYRVQVVADPEELVQQSLREKPFLIMVDLALKAEQVRAAVAELRQNDLTRHIPLIAYAPAHNPELLNHQATPGATLAVNDSAVLLHLNQILDQALQLE